MKLFRFENIHLAEIVDILEWTIDKTCTIRNQYHVTKTLIFCVVLWRLDTISRWIESANIFGKRMQGLSEGFWEGMEHIVETHGNLV